MVTREQAKAFRLSKHLSCEEMGMMLDVSGSAITGFEKATTTEPKYLPKLEMLMNDDAAFDDKFKEIAEKRAFKKRLDRRYNNNFVEFGDEFSKKNHKLIDAVRKATQLGISYGEYVARMGVDR